MLIEDGILNIVDFMVSRLEGGTLLFFPERNKRTGT